MRFAAAPRCGKESATCIDVLRASLDRTRDYSRIYEANRHTLWFLGHSPM